MDLDSWLQENKLDWYAERWAHKKWATFFKHLSNHVFQSP